jgi:acetyltransferase
MRTPPSLPKELAFDSEKAAFTIKAALRDRRTVLSKFEAKDLLGAYGIPVVATAMAATPAEVERLAQEIIAQAGACVIKIVTDDISHTSDVGGVRLGIEHSEEAERVAADMLRRITGRMPDARIKGFTFRP